jgi:hypothetical protein
LTITAKATKAKLLRLTSRAKSPKRPTKKVRAQAPAITDLKATSAAAVEAVSAAAPAVPGLDSDAGMPADQIGELVKPARGKAEPAPMSVRLDREPGRGWFHIVIDGERGGAVFKTTKKGVAFWAAETPDRALRTEGENRTAAVDAFVAMYHERQP